MFLKFSFLLPVPFGFLSIFVPLPILESFPPILEKVYHVSIIPSQHLF